MADTKKKLHLEVITPDAAVLNEDVDFIIVRALDGDLGILPGHAAIIASLDINPLVYEINGKKNTLAVAAGFLEVNGETATVITSAAEKAGDIDVVRSEHARERAEKRLHGKRDNIDVERAELALKRALCRLQVAHNYGGK